MYGVAISVSSDLEVKQQYLHEVLKTSSSQLGICVKEMNLHSPVFGRGSHVMLLTKPCSDQWKFKISHRLSAAKNITRKCN